jgi:hypothetical protein
VGAGWKSLPAWLRVAFCDLAADKIVDAWFDKVSLFGFCTLFAMEQHDDIIRMPDIIRPWPGRFFGSMSSMMCAHC